jgi:hypothetical protein
MMEMKETLKTLYAEANNDLDEDQQKVCIQEIKKSLSVLEEEGEENAYGWTDESLEKKSEKENTSKVINAVFQEEEEEEEEAEEEEGEDLLLEDVEYSDDPVYNKLEKDIAEQKKRKRDREKKKKRKEKKRKKKRRRKKKAKKRARRAKRKEKRVKEVVVETVVENDEITGKKRKRKPVLPSAVKRRKVSEKSSVILNKKTFATLANMIILEKYDCNDIRILDDTMDLIKQKVEEGFVKEILLLENRTENKTIRPRDVIMSRYTW